MPPRSRRRSSAILNCSAAAVVKAVLLLRRNSDNDTDNKFSFPFPAKRSSSSQCIADFTKPSSAPARGYRRKLQEKSKSPTIGRRPKSVRGQFEKNASHRSNSRVPVLANANESPPRTKVNNPKKLGDSRMTGKGKGKIKQSNTKNKKMKAAFKVPLPAKSAREATINIESRTDSPSFLPSVAVEKNVVQKPNVVIKEIINTGIPGRRFSPKTYRRFERSLFDVLDNPPKYEQSSSDDESPPAKSPVLNPWNLSLAATKWVSTVRQRRKSSPSPEVTSAETGQPPIIVVEDWAPGAALGEEESEEAKGFQLSTSRKTPTRRKSRSPTPVLDDVTEESEEEIQKYEEELMPSQR